MTNRKKIISIISYVLAGALLIYAVFCMFSPRTKTGVSTVAGDGQAFGKYEKPVTLSVTTTKDSTITSQVLPYLDNENLKSNRFTDLYKDKLNVEFNYLWEANSNEDYKTKLDNSITIGELPDVVMSDKDTIYSLYEGDYLRDMTDVWEQYASPLLKQITLQEGDGDMKAVTYDGKLYAIPQVYSSIDRAQFVWIRVDWINKLNSGLGLNLSTNPQTIDELCNIIKAFHDNYCYLTGESSNSADYGGLLMQGDFYEAMGGITGFINSYGGYPATWIDDGNGGLKFGSIQPEVKAALTKLNELYRGGYIFKEFVLKDTDALNQYLTLGRFGVVYGEQWLNSFPFQQIYENDNSVDWQAFPIPTATGTPAKVSVTNGTYGWWGVTKFCAHPEAIVKLMNVYVEAIWGAETYTDYETYYSVPVETAKGQIPIGVWKLSLIKNEPPRKNLDAYLAIKNAKADGTLDELTGEAKTIYSFIKRYLEGGDKTLWSWYNGYWPNEEKNTTYEVMNHYVENDLILLNKFTGAQTKTMYSPIPRMAQISDKANEVFTNIIRAGNPSDIDAQWNTLLSYFETMKGQDITREVNEWYNSHK